MAEEGGFLYDSDAYNDELPYYVQVHGRPHLVLPYGLANNDAKFIRGGMATGQDFFEYLKDAFDMLYREGAQRPRMMSVGLHLRLVGHPGARRPGTFSGSCGAPVRRMGLRPRRHRAPLAGHASAALGARAAARARNIERIDSAQQAGRREASA